MNARVLVTGGAGFVGSHVAAALRARDHDVVVLDDLSTGRIENLEGIPVTFVRGSVTDAATVARAMQGAAKVVHLAALPSVARAVDRPLDTHHVAATGTMVVLQAARVARARVVYAGSSSVYGDHSAASLHEGLREDPLSPYAAAKLAGELYCRSFSRVYGLPVVVARFFNVFGPRQPADSPYSGVVAAFCKGLLEGRAVRIDGDGGQARDFTYVEDIVGGLLQCLDAKTDGCETVNLAYGQATTVRELYTQLCELARHRFGVTSIPAPVAAPPRAGDVRHSQADVARAKARFHFAPQIGFAEGLRRTFDWYAQHSGRSIAQ